MDINVGDTVYYTRIIPKVGICDILTLRVRTVNKNSIVGVEDKTKISFVVGAKEFGNRLFTNYIDAKNVADNFDKSTLYKEKKDYGED